MTPEAILRARVFDLAHRFAGLGIDADALALTYGELAGLYAFLRRLAGH